MTITVLIADDQTLVRSGLRAIIESEPGMKVVGEAADGAEAVEAVRRLRPDVTLMDIRMPRLDGVAATRTLLRGAAPVPTRVVMLTTFHTDEYVTEALRAGASGFLLKEATADQFVDAVRAVAQGEAMLAPSVTRRLLERMAEDPTQSPDDADQIRNLLSAREVDVLLLVARGLSNAEISAKLHLAETTVKSHVQSMLAKLGVRRRIRLGTGPAGRRAARQVRRLRGGIGAALRSPQARGLPHLEQAHAASRARLRQKAGELAAFGAAKQAFGLPAREQMGELVGLSSMAHDHAAAFSTSASCSSCADPGVLDVQRATPRGLHDLHRRSRRG